MADRVHHGYSQSSEKRGYVRFNDPEPLAPLQLEAIRQKPDAGRASAEFASKKTRSY